ncbi:MAG: chemotaxis protein CheW [Deltaproteobacteria bacterium]|nr:chemotaxis protein CheW [Deltaproteobacteria bacterium]
MAEYLDFTCGGVDFVVDSRLLRAVVEGPLLTPVPLVPAVVAGVFNWKGKVQTCLDPSYFAGRACDDPRYGLVLDHPDGDMALCAEAVGKIFHVEGQGVIEAEVLAGRTFIAVGAFVDAVRAEIGGAGAASRADPFTG